MDQKSAVAIIKKHLWTFGHNVRDISGAPGTKYDLLVNDKIRVRVVRKRDKMPNVGDQDVVALVDEEVGKLYWKSAKPMDPENGTPVPHPLIPRVPLAKRPKRR